jgi:hypothetical protein
MYTFRMNSMVANCHLSTRVVARDLRQQFIAKRGQKDVLPRQGQLSCRSIISTQFDRLET